jgi:hypothetical protein
VKQSLHFYRRPKTPGHIAGLTSRLRLPLKIGKLLRGGRPAIQRPIVTAEKRQCYSCDNYNRKAPRYMEIVIQFLTVAENTPAQPISTPLFNEDLLFFNG